MKPIISITDLTKTYASGMQASHILSGMSRANCFIVLPRDSGPVEAGTEVEVIPFNGLMS